jgi:hypothetical protein
MVARTRRRLLREARAFGEKGTPPPGVDQPRLYLDARGGHFVAEPGVDWQEAYNEQLRNAEGPAKGSRGG